MTELQGFGKIHDFNEYDIDEYVLPTGGNYRIGITSNGRHIIKYVGRAENLNKRLKEHLDDLFDCDWFRVIYEADEIERYYKECYDYHYFGGSAKLKNKIHPDKPSGLRWWNKCPVCGR